MRSAFAWTVAGLLGACAPQGTTQSPEPGPDTGASAPLPGGDGEAAGEAAAGEAGTETAAPDGEAATTVAAAETSPTDGSEALEASPTDGEAAQTEPTTDAAASPEASAGDPKAKPQAKPTGTEASASETLALPKPIHGTVDSKCGKDPGVGESLKAFSLPAAGKDGETITQGTYRGRVLVVNFWGTWCKPCLKELPEFDQLYRRYRKHGMTLLAIATDEEAEGVLDFAGKRKLAAKLAIAGEEYAAKYGSPKFPFTFVIDYKGVIQASYRGYKPECLGALEADIREQLEIRAEAKAKRAKGKR